MPDLKLAVRSLWKTPLVNGVAILSLALGIGANGAIFSLFDQILLRSIPVAEPDRLVNLAAPGPKPGSQSCSNAGGCDEVFSYPMFRDLERLQKSFTGLAAHRGFDANIAYAGHSSKGGGLFVSGSYFPTLGLRPALGRLLDRGDDPAIGQSRVAVVSHRYWTSRFAADPGVVGDVVVVNAEPLTIVGVAPEGFRGTTLGSNPDLFVPITLRGVVWPTFSGFENRRSYWAYVFGRLQPGATVQEAAAALNVPYRAILDEVEAPLQEGMTKQTLAQFRAKELTLTSGRRGQSSILRSARVPLLLLFCVTGVVLLIACANVANLLLARSTARSGEIAVRLAMGARRRSLISQLLAESCLLALAAGVAGLVVARATLVAIRSLLPAEAVASVEPVVDVQVVGFSTLLALSTGVLFGLYPALRSTRVDVAAALQGQTGSASASRSAARFRMGLVVSQIALSTPLLVGAGLFVKSLVNVSRVELGIDADGLLTFTVSPELNGYSPERSLAFFAEVEEEIGALPGVREVAAAMVPVIAGNSWRTSLQIEGYDEASGSEPLASYNEVGPGFFRTLGISLLRGREFSRGDAVGAPPVAIVNQTFAERFGLGREAIGKRLACCGTDELEVEIVGLVQDSKYSDVKDATPPVFYTPYRQNERLGYISFYVRTALDPEAVLQSVIDTMARLDPNLPLEDLKTMPQQIRDELSGDRVLTLLSSSFAGVATLLAAIGLYGVLAYTVSQRTREFGLRMALGADGPRVWRMVLWQVGRVTAVGAVVGIAIAVIVGYVGRSLLFELESYDPLVLLASSLVLGLVALASGFFPALRASRVSPMNALRYQ